MTEPGSTLDGLTIALQPIHDRDYRHVADQLLYRQRHGSRDPVAETARALAAAIYELDDGRLLGERELFVDLPLEWLKRGELLPTPPSLMVIGLGEELAITPALTETLTAIRERGYRLTASSERLRSDDQDLLGLVDILRLSSPERLDAREASKLREDGKRLMAMDIRDPEQLEAYRRLGCDYFNGHYLAEPSFHAARPHGRHGNRTAQLRLVNELYRDDIDVHHLYELILQMPHLHVAILRRANSPHYWRGIQQTELRQAMQIIGLHELRRLVMTLSLASDLPSSKLMVRMALIRAFMCRNLAAPFRNIDPEDAFTTGLFSMMAALLDEDQQTLLAHVPLAPAMTGALTERQGHLGAILALAEEHERNLAEGPQAVHPDQLQNCYLDALDQTDALMNHL